MESTADDLEDALSQLLLRRNRTDLVAAALRRAPHPVDQATYPVLSGVARLGPIATTRLAQEVGLDRSGASRYADRLVAAGLLSRRADPDDARSALLILTPAGRRVIERARQDLKGHLVDITAHLRPRDRDALVAGLRALVRPTLDG